MEIWEKDKKGINYQEPGDWKTNLYFSKILLEHFNANIESDFYHFKETVKTGMSQRGKANRTTLYKKNCCSYRQKGRMGGPKNQ